MMIDEGCCGVPKGPEVDALNKYLASHPILTARSIGSIRAIIFCTTNNWDYAQLVGEFLDKHTGKTAFVGC